MNGRGFPNLCIIAPMPLSDKIRRPHPSQWEKGKEIRFKRDRKSRALVYNQVRLLPVGTARNKERLSARKVVVEDD